MRTRPLFISQTEAARLVGMSTATLTREEKAGRFPKRRLITPNRSAFLAAEVRAWADMRERVENVTGDKEQGSYRLYDTLKGVLEVLVSSGWQKEDVKAISAGIMNIIFTERLRGPVSARNEGRKCA